MERKVWGQLEENIDRLELEIRDMRTQVNRVIDLRTADACVFGEMAIRLHERLGDARKTKSRLFDYLSFTSGEVYAVAGSVGGKR